MTPDEARQALEESASLLLGHAITRVRYLGWWEREPEEPGAYVEYVELTMDDGAALRVTTETDDLGVCGVAIYEGAYPASPYGAPDSIPALEAATRLGWASIVGQPVAEAKLHWTELEAVEVQRHAGPPPSVSVGARWVVTPTALEIRVSQENVVFLTAASWSGDGSLFTDTDNVAVVFGDENARRLRVGR